MTQVTSPIGGVLDINNQAFLNAYEGKKILATTPQGQAAGSYYTIQGGKVYENPFDENIPNQTFDANFNVTTGLKPTATGADYATSEAFKYWLPTSYSAAQTATSNFGMGITPTADQYTGQTAGSTSGGTTLYLLKDGTVTSKAPPTGAATGGGQYVDPITGAAAPYSGTQAQANALANANTESPNGIQNIVSNMPIWDVPFKAGLSETQKSSIYNLVDSGRALNETDAKNYAYAIGDSNWQQWVGKSGMQLRKNTTPAGGVSMTNPSTTVSDVNQIVRAEWLGDATHPADVFVGTKAQIEAQARAAGINPANLYGTGFLTKPQTKTSTNGITTDSLSGQDKINLGTTASLTQTNQNSATTANTIVAGAQSAMQSWMDTLTPPETELDKQLKALTGEYNTALEGMKGQGAAQLAEEQRLGIPAKQQQIVDLTAELTNRIAEYNARAAQYGVLNQQIEGKAVSMGTIRGQQGQVNKMMLAEQTAAAADVGLLQARITGLQGQLTYAQDLANRAIDLKYADKQAEIDIKKGQIEALQPYLDKQEKLIAAAQQAVYDMQMAAIDEAKAKEKAIWSVATEAASKGVDSATIRKIENATTEIEAIQIATAAQTKIDLESQGYIKILNPAQLAGLTESDIKRMPNGDIYKIPASLLPITTSKSSSGGSSGGGGGGITTTKTIPSSVQTFEDYINEKEQTLQQSIANPEKYRAEYERISEEQTSNASIDEGAYNQLSTRAKAVYDNPILMNNYTPTEKGKILDEILNAGLDMGGTKPLSDTAIGKIGETESAIANLGSLRDVVSANLQYIGPISGLAKYNPYSKARTVQAEVDRVKQTVGKALEGGVLRKEDEEKYKKILAQLTDTPETALYKIDSLITTLQRDIDNYKSLQSQAGRAVSQTKTQNTEDLRTKYNY